MLQEHAPLREVFCVLDEGGDRLQGGGHVEVGAGQNRGEVAGVRVGVAQVPHSRGMGVGVGLSFP